MAEDWQTIRARAIIEGRKPAESISAADAALPQAAQPQAASEAGVADPSNLALGLGLGAVAALAALAWYTLPMPRLFARPGEDRSLLAPADPVALLHQRKAFAGDATAAADLGELYLQGGGNILPDLQIARRYLKMAADGGHAQGMLRLGDLYAAEGNFDEAVKWWDKSAAKDNATAMIKLGEAFAIGRGVARDRDLSLRWFERAFNAGDDNIKRIAANAIQQLRGN